MAYENLKSAIKQAIKNNNSQEITGDLLQSTLLSIVNTLGIFEIVQTTGKAEDKVMSQKATSIELDKKANANDVNNSIQELDKKLNRNLLAIEFDDQTGDLNAIIGQDSTINSVYTDEYGNVIVEQEII